MKYFMFQAALVAALSIGCGFPMQAGCLDLKDAQNKV